MGKYEGGCHCGKIRFEAEGDLGKVIECNCSICRRRAHLLWFVPRSQFMLEADPADLGIYKFNKYVIAHHFCRTCGVGPFSFGTDSHGNEMVAVNVRCLAGVELDELEIQKIDGRSF